MNELKELYKSYLLKENPQTSQSIIQQITTFSSSQFLTLLSEKIFSQFNSKKLFKSTFTKELFEILQKLSSDEFFASFKLKFSNDSFISSFAFYYNQIVNNHKTLKIENISNSELCEMMKQLSSEVFSKIEINYIPSELVQMNFTLAEETFEMLSVFKEIKKALNKKNVTNLITSKTLKNALSVTTETMLHCTSKKYALVLLNEYLSFLISSSSIDNRALYIHIQSTFYNRVIALVSLYSDNSETSKEDEEQFELLMNNLKELSYLGNGITPLMDIKHFSQEMQNEGVIKNYETLSVIKKLCEIPKLIFFALKTIKEIFWKNSINYAFLPNYLESIAFMAPQFKKNECDLIFEMMEHYIASSFDTMSVVEVFKQYVTISYFLYSHVKNPFLKLLHKYLNEDKIKYQKVFGSLIFSFINILIEIASLHLEQIDNKNKNKFIIKELEQFEQISNQLDYSKEEFKEVIENIDLKPKLEEIMEETIDIICKLLDNNEENALLLIKGTTLLKKVIQIFNEQIEYRNQTTKILSILLSLVNNEQSAAVATLIIDDIVNDVDPISKLECIKIIMKNSSVMKEVFGIHNCFNIYKKFIERWGYTQLLHEEVNENVLNHRLNILSSCINVFVITIKHSSKNQKRMEKELHCSFFDDFLSNNPWKTSQSLLLSSHLLSLMIQQPIEESQLIFEGKSNQLIILSATLLPALIRYSSNLTKEQYTHLFTILTHAFETPIELARAYENNIIEILLQQFPNSLEDPIISKLIEKLGRYSLKPNICKQFMKTLKTSELDDNLLGTLSYIASGETIGGLTFDTTDGNAFIENYCWFDSIPFSICGWFKLVNGTYTIVDIIPTFTNSSIWVRVNHGNMEIYYQSHCIITVQIPCGIWFHFCLIVNTNLVLFINNEKVAETNKIMPFQEGSYIMCVGTNKERHEKLQQNKNSMINNMDSEPIQKKDTQWLFQVSELMIINGTRSINDIRVMHRLGPQYKGRYCSKHYEMIQYFRNNSKTESETDLNSMIYIERKDIVYVMTDLIHDSSRTDLIMKGRVCLSAPSPFAECICRCGGITILLTLIEKSSTENELTNSLQLLMFCLRGSTELYSEAIKTGAFDILITLLILKQRFITHETLQTLIALTGIKSSTTDYTIIHPEILTTLVLDFRLLKSVPNGIEYVLKTLKSVYDYNPIEAAETLRGEDLMRKLMDLFIDDQTETSVVDCVTDLLRCILSVDCQKDEVLAVLSFTSYFLKVFDKSESDSHREWCAYRCSQLLTLLDQIVSVKGILPGLTSSFFYQFILVSNPPQNVSASLLRLAANMSQLSQAFCDEFYSEIDQLMRIVNIFTSSKETILALFALLLHTNPNEKEIFTTINPTTKPLCPRYLLILNEIIHTSLLAEYDQEKIELSQFIIDKLIQLIEKIKSLRQYIQQNDELLNNILSILVDQSGGYIGVTQMNKHQQRLCSGIIQFISIICSHMIIDSMDYKKVFIMTTILQPNGNLFKEIMLSTVVQLQLNQSSIPKDKLSKYFVDFSHFLLDIAISQTIRLPLFFVVDYVFILMNIFVSRFDCQTNDANTLWVELIDRVNLLMFDNISQENFLIATQHFHLQDYFFDLKHTDQYVGSFLSIIMTQLLQTDLSKAVSLYSSILKRVVMSYMNNLNKILPTRDLRKGFKSLLQMDTEKVYQWFQSRINELRSMSLQLSQYLKTFRNQQDERKDLLLKRIIQLEKDHNVDLEETRKGLEMQEDKLKEYHSKKDKAISNYLKERMKLHNKPITMKVRLKGEYYKMKTRLIMPKAVWEENVTNYKIDDVEGPLGLRRRIVCDYQFKDRYNIWYDEEIDRKKIELKPKDLDGSTEDSTIKTVEMIGIAELENDEIEVTFRCLHIVGINEIESMIAIDSNGIGIVDKVSGIKAEYSEKCKYTKFDWCDITTIAKRRYLLQNNAIEIFTYYGKSIFLVFEEHYDIFMKRLMKYKSEIVELSVESSQPIIIDPIRKVFAQPEMIELWKKGEISNFEYLLYLNSKAGRSKNDLSQYPVFPWILNNYKTDVIDLEDENNYRNFAFPIVAQTKERRERLQMKFEENGSHYGNHYSSLATTLIYLFRCEPYSKMHMQLFDGHFDTDRLLISISTMFENLSATPIELIPEFFYMSQFLMNINKINYGTRRDKNVVDDIELPLWCHGNPRKFVDINMKALESSYVSEHLHEWIDLIFGYKQRGKPAEDSCNIYPACSYEVGNISNMTEKEKNTIKDKIRNFGQTPIQLFKTPHPKREVTQTIYSLGIFEKDWTPSFTVIQRSKNTREEMKLSDKIEFNLKRENETYLSNGIITKERGGILKIERDGKILYIEECQEGNILVTNDRIIIVGGKDGSLQLIDIYNEIPMKKGRLCGHDCQVTCCCIGTKNNIIITGDEEGYCLIWDINSMMCLHSIHIDDHIVDMSINDETGNFIVVTKYQILYYDINGDLISQSDEMKDEKIVAGSIAQTPVWYTDAYVITGNKKGFIQLWKINEDYKFVEINSIETLPLMIHSFTLMKNNSSLILEFVNGSILCLN